MCGRYALNSTPRRIAAHFRLGKDQFDLFPRYNVAPTQTVAIVRENSGQRELARVVWGLIPSWAKDVSVGNRMINARAETAAEKPGFRHAMKYRRCLIPADGFYEWKKVGKGKQPYFIHRRDGEPMGLAGLWEEWKDKATGEVVQSCTVLTTPPNELAATIHDRMPLILSPDDYARWLNPTIQDPAMVADLLKPCPADWLDMRPVSSFVSNARNEGEQCLASPADPPQPDEIGGLFSGR